MNQAQRYEHLVGLTEGKKLDSDYRAAFYILSSVPELFEAAKKCVDSYGISFDKIKRTCKGNLEEYQSQLLSMAHNLFSWNSRTTATPHELSRLTYPWMEIACNAIFTYPVERFLCCYRRMKVGSRSWFWMQHLMRKQRGYTKDCKEWESGWRSKWKKQMQRKGKERKIENGIKYIIVRKEAAINDGFTVTKLPGLLLRLHHHTSTKQQ